MDLFEHRYYRLSKILMMLIGQWPYQSTRVKRGILTVGLILIASEIVPQILAVVKYRDNRAMLLECLILYVLGAIAAIKLLNFILHSQKRVKLINRIGMDWKVWARDREVNILHRYAAQGEKMTTLYTDLSMLHAVAMCLTFFVIMVPPLMPTIIDILLRNGTASRRFPYPIVYYNIDEQKYYFHLIMYSCVCACVLMMVIVSSDVALIIYIQHACGMFSALGHKLKRIASNEASIATGETRYALRKKDMMHLASCIDRHNDAIKYANLIEATYTRTFFIVTGLGVIMLNGAGLQVLMRTSDLTTTTRFILCTLATIFYFYIECYVSQILIDHSKLIHFYIYNSQWYKQSPTVQKILQFMMMRCTVPCQLTAGKMMVLSVRTFWLTMKTSLSFFGFLRSTQGL